MQRQDTARLDRRQILEPFYREIATFRTEVRQAAKEQLRLTDEVRERFMLLGLRMEDSADFAYKEDDPETLRQELELKRRAREAKEMADLKNKVLPPYRINSRLVCGKANWNNGDWALAVPKKYSIALNTHNLTVTEFLLMTRPENLYAKNPLPNSANSLHCSKNCTNDIYAVVERKVNGCRLKLNTSRIVLLQWKWPVLDFDNM